MKSWLTYAVRTIVIAAMAMAAVSCAQSGADMPIVDENQSIDVVFQPTLDGVAAMRVGEAAYIDKLFVEVYMDDYKVGDRLSYDVVGGAIADFSLALIADQRYTILFWAQDKDSSAYDITDFRDIKIDYTANASFEQFEMRDVFCTAISFTVTAQTARQRVSLFRPFALLSVGTKSSNYNSAITGQSCKLELKDIPTSYNLFNGKAGTKADVELTFDIDGRKVADYNDYTLLGVSYLLPAEELNLTVTTTVGANQKQITTVQPALEANKRYNILGESLLPN